MPSFQISVSPSRRQAARFVGRVRRSIQKALAEENAKTGLTQSDMARAIGVHRSVINREIRGMKDLTLGRVAELAYAMGRRPRFELDPAIVRDGSNVVPSVSSSSQGAVTVTSATFSVTDAATR
jgi:DNA-binding transcriptional regulator YdaS (Cro superfamily)